MCLRLCSGKDKRASVGVKGRVRQSRMQEDVRDSQPPGVTGLGAVVHPGDVAGGEEGQRNDGLIINAAFPEHLGHTRASAKGFTCLVLSKVLSVRL